LHNGVGPVLLAFAVLFQPLVGFDLEIVVDAVVIEDFIVSLNQFLAVAV